MAADAESVLLEETIEAERRVLKKLLREESVRVAMRLRCNAHGHESENGISMGMTERGPSLRVTSVCRWCGESNAF